MITFNSHFDKLPEGNWHSYKVASTCMLLVSAPDRNRSPTLSKKSKDTLLHTRDFWSTSALGKVDLVSCFHFWNMLELDSTPVLSIRKAQKHLSSRWICWWISHWRVEHFQPRMSVAPGEPYRLYGEARNKTVLGSFLLRGAHHARLLLVVVCKPSTLQPSTFDII